jgi:hypothetical protein
LDIPAGRPAPLAKDQKLTPGFIPEFLGPVHAFQVPYGGFLQQVPESLVEGTRGRIDPARRAAFRRKPFRLSFGLFRVCFIDGADEVAALLRQPGRLGYISRRQGSDQVLAHRNKRFQERELLSQEFFAVRTEEQVSSPC